MVHRCIVPGCPNRSDKKDNLKFHRLPLKNDRLLQTYLDLIGLTRSDITDNSRICSAHFSERGLWQFHSKVPDIFPWSQSSSAPSSSPPGLEGSQSIAELPTQSASLTPPETPRAQSTPPLASCRTCVVLHDHSYSTYHHTHTPIATQSLLSDNTGSVSLSSTPLTTRTIGNQTCNYSHFCIENFVADDAAIHFYTGFEDYPSLLAFFEYLGQAAYHLKYWGYTPTTTSVENRGSSRRLLTPLNELFLVLCRLRCGLLECDLAYRFGVSQPTVSRIVITWINFLYAKFKDVTIWPSRKQVTHFMPQVFKEYYPTTRCIIDATEIFIQSPSDPKAQQLTFSSYKNHNTFKSLVCITPCGSISFISKLYGGSISDRELTEKSGLLDLLEPGDSIMADRGFTIADLTIQRGITLNIPPMKHEGQFTEAELLTTRRIASLRIHVERAIGRIKNFRILNDIPNSMARNADQIFYVCAMLSNFNSPLCSK